MVTDISEKGLETIIVESLINDSGYQRGESNNFDKDHAIDWQMLFDFLEKTQEEIVEKLNLNEESSTKTQFLHRLQEEITKRGVIEILRNGIKHHQHTIQLFYGSPSQGNETAKALYEKNIFSVTRQLHYSKNETQLSLDIVIFINGLPVATFELKNKLTKQTVQDAISQYKRDRSPRELLFQLGRCAVHFAIDDHEVQMCTHLNGKSSWFLPFNKGFNGGAGNPSNPNGIATDYLWKNVLKKESLTNIIENYAQITEEINDKGCKQYKQIFPRYHQLDVVRKLLKDALESSIGKRYLIQHSAGSGKSNSIAWLAHQLIELKKDNKDLFDSVIIVTDRKVLDKQIKDTIKQFAQVSAVLGHAQHSGDLQKFLHSGKKIIVTTVQKFPFVLKEIGDEHRKNKFAIIIDEAHSSQGGRTAAKMNMALSEERKKHNDHIQDDQEYSFEDQINDLIKDLIKSKKMLKNSNYFAFTATPKNKTLEIFGEPYKEGEVTKYKPFHSYTMKQAIQEGFIMDVIKNYTTVDSYYKLLKSIEGDPLYDTKKAQKKLRTYVESHSHAIKEKTEIMIDHFHDYVGSHKIGGKARAMVVTGGIERAIQYHHAFKDYLKERKSPYRSIVAFSGEYEYREMQVTEMKLNGFSSNSITDKFKEDPYRFLIVADKFQTGYDEPLLHTMYVDKMLTDIKAVQALSRLNRAHPQKYDTFVLDFYNDAETIQKAFSSYYSSTILSQATDPNKLHDLKAELDGYQVYAFSQVEELVFKYLKGDDRKNLDSILDICVSRYNSELEEDAQVDFKGKAKAFVRTYGFLVSILSYASSEWEKLSIFLNFLIPKLPAPREDDLSKGILETIDMDSYRLEMRSVLKINLDDEDTEIEPIPTSTGGRKAEPELDHLTNIIKTFNEMFGDIAWKDTDKVIKVIIEEIPRKVAANEAYKNAMTNSDKENARIEHDNALKDVMVDMLNDQIELYKQFMDNSRFKQWLNNFIFNETYKNDRY